MFTYDSPEEEGKLKGILQAHTRELFVLQKYYGIRKIIFLVIRLKVIEKRCLNWFLIHGAIYCCVKYSSMEYQDETFRTYH